MSRTISKLWKWMANHPTRRTAGRSPRRRGPFTLESLERRVVMAADTINPLSAVVDYQDLDESPAEVRSALETQGLDVVVAAATTEVARPHTGSGQGADGGLVRPDLALTDVEAEDYSAIVFSGGWGMAQYQYGFEGTYHNSAFEVPDEVRAVVNDLINDFARQDKHVAAVCYGVSVLAYAQVDGESLPAGKTVTAWAHTLPSVAEDDVIVDGNIITAENYDAAAAFGAADDVVIDGRIITGENSGPVDPSTATDDVYVEGRIITAENFDSAAAVGEALANVVKNEAARTESQPKPVLMVIANQDFYHREYYETRESLEAAGLEVVVAAATTDTATPHAISVVEGREPSVDPDLALSDVKAEDYSAIVFIGGYGAASYQYANATTYDNPAY